MFHIWEKVNKWYIKTDSLHVAWSHLTETIEPGNVSSRCVTSAVCKVRTQSVSQFSCLVVSDSLQPHESQHARPPCPSPTPGVHLDSHPWSQWCHPAISSSVVPFSSCPQSLPASESFPMSQLFAWGGQVLEFHLHSILG